MFIRIALMMGPNELLNGHDMGKYWPLGRPIPLHDAPYRARRQLSLPDSFARSVRQRV